MFSISGMFGREQARVARKASSPRSSPYTAPGKSTLSQILRLLALSVEQGRPNSPSFHLSLSYGKTRNINQPHQCGGTEDKALSPIQKDLFGCSNDCSLSPICQRSEPGLANTACCSALSLFAESAATPVRKHSGDFIQDQLSTDISDSSREEKEKSTSLLPPTGASPLSKTWVPSESLPNSERSMAAVCLLQEAHNNFHCISAGSETVTNICTQDVANSASPILCSKVLSGTNVSPQLVVIVSFLRENVRSKKITNIVQHKHV